jgi:AcrR family transcriptional regulator
MLELVGERGYREVTIADVLERSGSHRAQFYAVFGGKAGCFEAAYANELDDLLARLLGPCDEGLPWASGLRGALEELATYVVDDPGVVRGVLSDAWVAGDRADAKRRDALALLTRRIDAARAEIGALAAPPPISARFIVGAVIAASLHYLTKPVGRDFRAELRDVLYMTVDLYLGPEAARAAADAFRSGTLPPSS